MTLETPVSIYHPAKNHGNLGNKRKVKFTRSSLFPE